MWYDDRSAEIIARYLHVMPKLEIRCECQSLSHSDISPCLEKHHRDGSSGKHVSNNELRNDADNKGIFLNVFAQLKNNSEPT